MTVVGTRPEIIRLARVIAKLDQYSDHILVHTGQNYDYELNEIFFDDFGLKKPKYFLQAAGTTSSETIGNTIIKIEPVLLKEKPDALLVLGDTNSSMVVLTAKRHKIPIFHMEAGNRCFDQRVPEEINRKIADHTADINLTYSTIARNYLIEEGLPAKMIIKTGSPMYEVLNYFKTEIENSDVLTRLNLLENQYFLVSSHREENIDCDKNFLKLVTMLNNLADTFKLPIIVSTHPRTQKRIDQLNIKFAEEVRLLKPLGFKDYNKLQICAKTVLSDSGTISEESAILNFPALNIRETHERPEAMEQAVVMMVGLNSKLMFQALAILMHQSRGSQRLILPVADYDIPNVSDKVLRIIHSYTDYVKRVVWNEY